MKIAPYDENLPFELGRVTVAAESDDDIHVVGEAVDLVTREPGGFWLPRSAVHSDGEIRLGARAGDSGRLVVRHYFAKGLGWCP